MFHMLHFSWGKGHGAGGKRLVIPLLCRFIPPFSTFIIYSLAPCSLLLAPCSLPLAPCPLLLAPCPLLLAPCSLLLAPYETEQAGLAKVEFNYLQIKSVRSMKSVVLMHTRF